MTDFIAVACGIVSSVTAVLSLVYTIHKDKNKDK